MHLALKRAHQRYLFMNSHYYKSNAYQLAIQLLWWLQEKYILEYKQWVQNVYILKDDISNVFNFQQRLLLEHSSNHRYNSITQISAVT